MTQSHPWQRIKNFIHLMQSEIMHFYHGYPAKDLKVIAITGTDGKTTTASMLYHILKQNKIKVGLISTVSAYIGDEEIDTGLHVTTPDPWDVPKYLRQMKDRGIEIVIFETTSSGLQQNRLHRVNYFSAGITNIRSDHLDYHGTWDNYADAKFKVAERLKSKGKLIINLDDKRGSIWLEEKLQDLKKEIDIVRVSKDQVTINNKDVGYIDFSYNSKEFKMNLMGEYNIENALIAINLASDFLDNVQIANGLESFLAPKGRMEVVYKEDYTIVIDFAHTPGSLQSALESINEVKDENSNLIAIFGCAGKRDKSRRKMGAVAAKHSDIMILTAEDPRDEKTKDINSQIITHAGSENGELVFRITNHDNYIEIDKSSIVEIIKNKIMDGKTPIISFDEDNTQNRQDAIDFGIGLANVNDIVFITGKAHEVSLAFGENEKEFSWSDHEAVKLVLSNKKEKD